MNDQAPYNPFPGPQPYRSADRISFFGRRDIAQKLLNRILAAPCVTLFGPSGSGKSSLMQASVIPMLMEQYGFRVVRIDGWLAGEPPLQRLVHALFVQLELGDPPEGLSPRELLEEALRLAERRSERPILIFLDQLEQPLLPDRSAQQLHELLEGLEALAQAPVRGLQLVLSLREDYLGRFRDEARDHRALLDPGFRLGPLKVKEMAQVAHKVLSTAAPEQTWSFEELKELLIQVRTAGQSATDMAEVQAAFAQIVCRTLWEEQRPGHGRAGPVEAEPILHRYLDATLDSLGPLRPAALTLLEDHLVARDGSRTLLTQREAEDALPAGAAAQVLDTLERAAVLHAEQHQGGRYFELGHDWLAKKVTELKRERQQQVEEARTRQLEALRRHQEHVARRKLIFVTASAAAVALLMLGLFVWGLRAQTRAFNLSLMAGARELMQRGQPTMAAKLLAEVKHPENFVQREQWEELALEVLESNFLEVTLRGPGGESINAASFSPDGELIVTASNDGSARVWRTDNKEESQLLKEHTGPVTSAEFSPDGQLIVTASRDGTARVWGAGDSGLAVRRKVLKHTGPVHSARFSPDGQRIVTVSDGIAQVWQWQTEDTAGRTLESPGKRINFAAFSPDPKVQRIVTTSWQGAAQVWQADGAGAFSVRKELPEEHGRFTSVAFSPDGQRIVTASQDGIARVWRERAAAPSFELDQELSGHGPVTSAEFSPDGQLIVTASRDGTARVWRAGNSGLAVMLKELKGHMGPVISAAFNLDGQRVVTASQDGTARVWNADITSQPMILDHRRVPVTDAMYSPDGQLIVTAAQDGIARVWQADGSKPPIELPRERNNALSSVAFSPDGRFIIATSWDTTVQRWKLQAGQWKEFRPIQHPAQVTSAAFSHDGQRIVTASRDGVVRVWQADGSRQPIELAPTGDKARTSVAFSPDDQFIITVSRDSAVKVWRADGLGEPRTLDGHLGPVTSATFSPDGGFIATTSQDGKARVWRTDGSENPFGELLQVFPHDGPVQSATFSSDGQFLVTTSWDGTAWVRRTDGSGHPRMLKGHEGAVRAAAFSDDDRHIVTASSDGTARIWLRPEVEKIHPPQLLELLKEQNKDCLPSTIRQTYLREGKREARKGYEQCELERKRVSSQAVELRSDSRAAGAPSRM